MSAPVVIFAVGNPSRGDDAIGPMFHGQLEKWLKNENQSDQFDLIEDFQLQIEHVLDLQGRELALFIDAGAHTPGPFTFRRIAPATGITHTTHELPPEAVLQVLCKPNSPPRRRPSCSACGVNNSNWVSRSVRRLTAICR
jgi:hydrogenase maturation protease